MSIATIDAWFWCAHVESMKATLNQRQLRETERCPRSNCLRMDWRSSTDCCHGNSAGRSWALDQGKSARLAAFVASLNFSEGVICCKIVAADSAAEEIPKYHEIVMVFGKWMIDHQGLAFLWEKIFEVFAFSTDWDSVFDNFLGTWRFSMEFSMFETPFDAHVFRAATPGIVVRFSVLLHEATPETVRGEPDWITGSFWNHFFLQNPLWNSICCIEYMIETSMSRCKSWSSFPIKNNQGTKIKQFSCGFLVEVYLCCQHCSCCVWISLLRVLWKRWEITQPVAWEVYKSMGDRTAMWILHFWVMHFDVRSCVELYLLLEAMEMDHVSTGKISTSSSKMLAHRVSTCSNSVLVGAWPIALFIMPLKPGIGGFPAASEMMV